MKLRYTLALATLLWGWQTGLWYFAIPMALVGEARHFWHRRWALERKDFYRVADLTAVAFVVLIVFLFVNRREYHFITTLVQWLPILFFPLTAVLAYSTTERMPLDVIFYSLRRQRQPVTRTWDMTWVFFGMCLVAAGTNTHAAGYYLPVIATIIFIAMFGLRSPRYAGNTWILAACIILLAAWFTQQGLRSGHLAFKAQARQWLADYINSRTNPLKTHSAIGSVGRLKLSDAIAFRIDPGTSREFPSLLQEATYEILSDTDWVVLNPRFSDVPQADNFRWRFAPKSPNEHHARIYLEFDRNTDIVPIPADVTEVNDLPAMKLRLSKFGSLEAQDLTPSPGYDIAWAKGSNINAPPDVTDTFVPQRYQKLLEQVAATSKVPPDEPIRKIQDIFRDFHYSLYEAARAATHPMRHFLLESRAGHCEYFASATVLLLRHLGVPARYAIGYAVQEFNEDLGMYIVRKRHAHAWAIAWINGKWVPVDTTPGVWAQDEAAQASPLRPVLDWVSNRSFQVRVWWSKQKLEDYKTELYILGFILAAILAWRIATSEQVVLNKDQGSEIDGSTNRPGMDSPFFRIEAHLREAGLVRGNGELPGDWLRRVGHPELMELLGLHNRLRFDPRGLPEAERARLAREADEWLETADATGNAA